MQMPGVWCLVIVTPFMISYQIQNIGLHFYIGILTIMAIIFKDFT